MRHALAVLCLTVTLTPHAVMRVIDGDTFVLHHVGTPAEEHIRVLRVDTPERGEPLYAEAGEFTRQWLARGAFTMTMCKRDSFGRYLAEVTRGHESLADALRAAGYDHDAPLSR